MDQTGCLWCEEVQLFLDAAPERSAVFSPTVEKGALTGAGSSSAPSTSSAPLDEATTSTTRTSWTQIQSGSVCCLRPPPLKTY